MVLNTAIYRLLGYHSSRLGRVPGEELEDIAAEKSLDILRRIETGTWEVTARTPVDVMRFLSKTARYGLLDALRDQGRRVELDDPDEEEWKVGGFEAQPAVAAIDPPDTSAERSEFSRALVECAGNLDGRSRQAWLLRAFAGLSSSEIARHPAVRRKASHVDVIVQRARRAVRECMRRKGHNPSDVPPGAFVELWSAFELEVAESA
jgi:RNA polymerase sigma factor (sigma-70 family)